MKKVLIIGSLLIGGSALGQGEWSLSGIRTDVNAGTSHKMDPTRIEVPPFFREYLAARKFGDGGAFTGFKSRVKVAMYFNNMINGMLEDQRAGRTKGKYKFDYCTDVKVDYEAPNRVIGTSKCSSLESGKHLLKIIMTYNKK